MARQAGKSADFAYNSVAIEDELSSITQTTDVNLVEVTAFGDSAATFVEGLLLKSVGQQHILLISK